VQLFKEEEEQQQQEELLSKLMDFVREKSLFLFLEVTHFPERLLFFNFFYLVFSLLLVCLR